MFSIHQVKVKLVLRRAGKRGEIISLFLRSSNFVQTSRGAILVFLLQQATMNCPYVPERCGVLNPFTEYILSARANEKGAN